MLCNFFLLICVRVCNIINVTILRGDVVRRAGGRAEVQGGQGHATGKSGSVRGKWATRLRGPRVRRSPCGPAAEASLARCTSLSQGCFPPAQAPGLHAESHAALLAATARLAPSVTLPQKHAGTRPLSRLAGFEYFVAVFVPVCFIISQYSACQCAPE